MKARNVDKGFALVEALAASIILCLAVIVLAAGSTQCLSATRLNRQREVASALADKQLTMIDYVGIEEFVELGQTEGEFEEFERGYRWKAVTEARAIDNLYKVTVTVSWIERNRPYSVSVDTMLNGRGMSAGI
ncbi:MAG: type IV pilus modification PilV family protein [Planctomycetota bacterium]